jgi:protein gp37
MPAKWAEDIMEECDGERVAFFMKQMSGRRPIPAELLVHQYPPGAGS